MTHNIGVYKNCFQKALLVDPHLCCARKHVLGVLHMTIIARYFENSYCKNFEPFHTSNILYNIFVVEMKFF